MSPNELIEAFLVAAARLYLYEFNGPLAQLGSTRWTWPAYHLAMQVAYDEEGYVRGSDHDGPEPPPVGKVILN